MIQKELQKLINKYLLPKLEGYLLYKRFIYKAPIDHLLRGFYFENSGFRKSTFNVTAFVQPLFVPHENIVFTFGGRLRTLSGGPEKWWTVDENNQEQVCKEILELLCIEGMPFIEQFNTVKDFIRIYQEKAQPPHLHYMEAVAYANLLQKKTSNAKKLLNACVGLLHEVQKGEHVNPSMAADLSRHQEMLFLLKTDRKKAVDLLLFWEQQTKQNLGVD